MTVTFADILKLTKQLLPTGRAWKVPFESQFHKLLYALGMSEQRALQFALSTLDRLLPDNDNFTTDDATEWERRLNISGGTGYVPLETRKATILRKMQFPGNFLNRQNYRYLEAQLQLAGYNVTVTENFTEIGATTSVVHSLTTIHGLNTKHGKAIAGDLIANSSTIGEVFAIDTYLGVFYIDGEIPQNSITAFRQLVLMLKPVNTVAILRVTYTKASEFIYMDGDTIGLMSGDQLILMH
jgi:uncharacterized protein YmfQ (DUF2313 family)